MEKKRSIFLNGYECYLPGQLSYLFIRMETRINLNNKDQVEIGMTHYEPISLLSLKVDMSCLKI